MLSMKIKEHRPLIMRYAKASGMLLLGKYLPDLNPWKNLEIVQDIEDWEQIKGNYPDRLMCRTDNLLGSKAIRVRGTSGRKEDVSKTIEEIKRQSKDAVMLIMENKFPNIARYKNNGGFTVNVNLYQDIIIELVGKGFDASEITREKAVHERYVIPWSEVLFIKDKKDIMKNPIATSYVVSEEEYQRSRQERIKAIIDDFHESSKEVEENIPMQYTTVNEATIEDIIDDIIFPLYCKKR